MTLSLYDEFAGAGGSTQGAAAIPGVEPILAANHNALAVESHAANFPKVEHFLGDIAKADIAKFPRADIFWASPSCPPWSNARGKRRDFDKSSQGVLFGADGPDENTARSRALMEEIPRYLRAMSLRGKPVLAGVVENVVECRLWDQWDRWIGEIRALGYRTRVIAINSMHARPRFTHRAPQSRDRLFVAYWHESIGRTPDWDKWLRPRAYCPSCEEWVDALQVFKKPGQDMGCYRSQYVYRCPKTTCRNRVVEPQAAPAAVAIDWTLPGTRIGDRENRGMRPLADKTLARIRTGLDKYAVPFLTPAGGTWRDDPSPVTAPMATRTTRETDGIAVPPLLVPVEGRDGKQPAPATAPLRTQTARNETGLAWLPFITPMRGGGDQGKARPVWDPLGTVSAGGNHHGLAFPEGIDAWTHLLVPYHSSGVARPVAEPTGTFTTKDRFGLASSPGALIDVNDVLFRMLEPHEIGRGMAFADDYIVLGNKRDRVRQYGNAVTPPVAEVIVSALVEAITGELVAS